MGVPAELTRDMIELADRNPAIRLAAANRLERNADNIALSSAVWGDLVGYLEQHRQDIGKGNRNEDLAFLQVFTTTVQCLSRKVQGKTGDGKVASAVQRLLPFSREIAMDRPLDLGIRRLGYIVVRDFGTREDLAEQIETLSTWPEPPTGDQHDRKTNQDCIHGLLRRHVDQSAVDALEVRARGLRRQNPNDERLIYLDQIIGYARQLLLDGSR